MNVLLVRPRPEPESIGLQSFMICEPLELECLSACVEPLGHRVAIVDMILERRGLRHFLRKHRPDIVGFTSYAAHVGVVRRYARKVKAFDPRIATAVGGVQAEVVPEDFEDPAVDFVVHADALASFVAILGALPRGRDAIRRDVPGVWNGPDKAYPPPRDPAALPRPDRTKTRRYRGRYDYIFHSRCATIKTAVGCPHACAFCFCIAAARHRYAERDLEDVVAELKEIRERNVFIVDDTFLLRPERVTAFCDLLERERVQKRFVVFGRADFVAAHPESIARFRSLGLQAVFLGLESFRQQDLQALNKRLSVAESERAIRVLEALGVECHGGIMVGPDWDRKDFDGLIAWLRQFRMVFVNLQPLTPMPGTPLFERLRERVTVSRERYAEWDMAHVVVQPGRLTRRGVYANILRAYYRTFAGLAGHRYVWRRYGARTYLRTLRGSLHITWQYVRLWARG